MSTVSTQHDDELEALRRTIRTLPGGRARRFGPALRSGIMSYALTRTEAGISRAAIAKELGIRSEWLSRALNQSPVVGSFVPVTITGAEEFVSESGLTLRGPCGVSISGLSISTAAALIRELSCSG